MLLTHTLTMCGSVVSSLVDFRPSGLGGYSVTDRKTDDGRTE